MPLPRIAVTGLDTYGLHSPKYGFYLGHVRAAGAIPKPMGRRQMGLPARIGGLLLIGGEDVEPVHYGAMPHGTYRGNKGRDKSELALAREALTAGMPILAICRGCQLLNVVLGGSLIQDIPSHVTHPLQHEGGQRHEVRIPAGTRFASLVGAARTEVNSYHHQAVERLAPGLQINAWADDGVAEGWEPLPGGPIRSYVMAVQWHPERCATSDPVSRALFADFTAAARDFAARAQGRRSSPPGP